MKTHIHFTNKTTVMQGWYREICFRTVKKETGNESQNAQLK